MKLKDLGWNRHFSTHFKKYKEQGLIPARVFSEQRKTYLLYSKKGELKANARGILWHQKNIKSETPVVGDWVAIEPLREKDNALIKAVIQRKNSFSRRTAGGRKKIGGGEPVAQIIAANIDLAFIVVGLDRDFNPRRIERYMALVQSRGAEAVIILNKADLCKTTQMRKKEVQKLFPDIAVRTLVALNKKEVSSLKKYINPGMTTAVLGSSGVGKSTIVNKLLGYDKQFVKNISGKAGKGQHATSRRELMILPQGGIIMDNPGMREIQLWGDEDDLFDTFRDIEQHAQKCKFRNCRHESEPGCAVRVAVDQGIVDKKRYLNYLKLKSELCQLGQKQKKGQGR